jgi:hypothetical protein
MKYRRPNNRESTNSWVSIWLGCMDTRFTSRGANVHTNTKISKQCKEYTNLPPKRLGSSLHQGTCGSGFSLRERHRVYPSVQAHRINYNDFLGVTPSEARAIAIRWRRKHGYSNY